MNQEHQNEVNFLNQEHRNKVNFLKHKKGQNLQKQVKFHRQQRQINFHTHRPITSNLKEKVTLYKNVSKLKANDTRILHPFHSNSEYQLQLENAKSSILIKLRDLFSGGGEQNRKKKAGLSNGLHRNQQSPIQLPIKNGVINSIFTGGMPDNNLEFESVVPLIEADSGVGLMVVGKWKECGVLCVVDTGAMETILPGHTLPNFKIFKKLPKLILKSFSQEKVNTKVRAIVEMRLPGYGRTRQAVSFVDNVNCGLLGLPLLRAVEASVICKDRNFFLGYGKTHSKKVNNVSTVSDITLLPKSQISQCIQVIVNKPHDIKNGKNLVYVEGSKHVLPHLTYLALCPSTNETLLNCCFFNPTAEPVVIAKGSKLPIELNPEFRKTCNFDTSRYSFDLTPVDCDENQLRAYNSIFELPMYGNVAIQSNSIGKEVEWPEGSNPAELEAIPSREKLI